MSQIQSDNFLYANPKPPQEYERQPISATVYQDWPDTATIDAFFATPPLDLSYRNNKYFWVAGALMQFNGTSYRSVSSDASQPVQSTTFTVEETGDTVMVDALEGSNALVMILIAGVIYDSSQVTLNTSTGELDATSIGGFYVGNFLTILYK